MRHGAIRTACLLSWAALFPRQPANEYQLTEDEKSKENNQVSRYVFHCVWLAGETAAPLAATSCKVRV